MEDGGNQKCCTVKCCTVYCTVLNFILAVVALAHVFVDTVVVGYEAYYDARYRNSKIANMVLFVLCNTASWAAILLAIISGRLLRLQFVAQPPANVPQAANHANRNMNFQEKIEAARREIENIPDVKIGKTKLLFGLYVLVVVFAVLTGVFENFAVHEVQWTEFYTDHSLWSFEIDQVRFDNVCRTANGTCSSSIETGYVENLCWKLNTTLYGTNGTEQEISGMICPYVQPEKPCCHLAPFLIVSMLVYVRPFTRLLFWLGPGRILLIAARMEVTSVSCVVEVVTELRDWLNSQLKEYQVDADEVTTAGELARVFVAANKAKNYEVKKKPRAGDERAEALFREARVREARVRENVAREAVAPFLEPDARVGRVALAAATVGAREVRNAGLAYIAARDSLVEARDGVHTASASHDRVERKAKNRVLEAQRDLAAAKVKVEEAKNGALDAEVNLAQEIVHVARVVPLGPAEYEKYWMDVQSILFNGVLKLRCFEQWNRTMAIALLLTVFDFLYEIGGGDVETDTGKWAESISAIQSVNVVVTALLAVVVLYPSAECNELYSTIGSSIPVEDSGIRKKWFASLYSFPFIHVFGSRVTLEWTMAIVFVPLFQPLLDRIV